MCFHLYKWCIKRHNTDVKVISRIKLGFNEILIELENCFRKRKRINIEYNKIRTFKTQSFLIDMWRKWNKYKFYETINLVNTDSWTKRHSWAIPFSCSPAVQVELASGILSAHVYTQKVNLYWLFDKTFLPRCRIVHLIL